MNFTLFRIAPLKGLYSLIPTGSSVIPAEAHATFVLDRDGSCEVTAAWSEGTLRVRIPRIGTFPERLSFSLHRDVLKDLVYLGERRGELKVDFDEKTHTMKVKAGSFKTVMSASPAVDGMTFPVIKDERTEHLAVISSDVLAMTSDIAKKVAPSYTDDGIIHSNKGYCEYDPATERISLFSGHPVMFMSAEVEQAADLVESPHPWRHAFSRGVYDVIRVIEGTLGMTEPGRYAFSRPIEEDEHKKKYRAAHYTGYLHLQDHELSSASIHISGENKGDFFQQAKDTIGSDLPTVCEVAPSAEDLGEIVDTLGLSRTATAGKSVVQQVFTFCYQEDEPLLFVAKPTSSEIIKTYDIRLELPRATCEGSPEETHVIALRNTVDNFLKATLSLMGGESTPVIMGGMREVRRKEGIESLRHEKLFVDRYAGIGFARIDRVDPSIAPYVNVRIIHTTATV